MPSESVQSIVAKEIYNFKDLKLGEICNSEDDEEIRKILAFLGILIERFMKASNKIKESIIEETQKFSDLSGLKLTQEIVGNIESLKDTSKPKYEVLNYMLPGDSTIYAVVQNRKENQTESFYVKLEDNETLESYLQKLVNKLNAENHKETTNNKYISNLKKKISILKQIMELRK